MDRNAYVMPRLKPVGQFIRDQYVKQLKVSLQMRTSRAWNQLDKLQKPIKTIDRRESILHLLKKQLEAVDTLNG